IVGDHSSADATRDMLVNLSREFDSLGVGHISGFGYSQGGHITRLVHAAQTAFFADYVVLLDADEFIDAPDRAAFLTALSVIPSGGYGLTGCGKIACKWRFSALLAGSKPSFRGSFGVRSGNSLCFPANS